MGIAPAQLHTNTASYFSNPFEAGVPGNYHVGDFRPAGAQHRVDRRPQLGVEHGNLLKGPHIPPRCPHDVHVSARMKKEHSRGAIHDETTIENATAVRRRFPCKMATDPHTRRVPKWEGVGKGGGGR